MNRTNLYEQYKKVATTIKKVLTIKELYNMIYITILCYEISSHSNAVRLYLFLLRYVRMNKYEKGNC